MNNAFLVSAAISVCAFAGYAIYKAPLLDDDDRAGLSDRERIELDIISRDD